MANHLDLKAAIDLFIDEFSDVETHSVGMALRSMAGDDDFAQQSEQMLGPEARLTLLKRMAYVRNVEPHLIAQLDSVRMRAKELAEKRDELLRTLRLIETERSTPDEAAIGVGANPRTGSRAAVERVHGVVWVPTISEVDKCRNSTAKLRATLSTIVDEVAVAATPSPRSASDSGSPPN